MSSLRSFDQLATWPVRTVAAAVLRAGERIAEYGPQDVEFELASVTKPLVAYAAFVAVEEGVIELDQDTSMVGVTPRHLLAHTSGLAFKDRTVQAQPGSRRIYSSSGFEMLGEIIEQESGITFAEYLAEAVFEPLGMTKSALRGSAGHGAVSTVSDLTKFARELQRPSLIAQATYDEALSVQFPGLNGVVPGYGMQRPCDWALGLELKGTKSPHWTGAGNSPRTVGHFGQSGTFLWVDPQADVACVVLTDEPFGSWCTPLWPTFNDDVLAEAR